MYNSYHLKQLLVVWPCHRCSEEYKLRLGSPVLAVWYCRQFSSGAFRLPHSYCVTLICQLLEAVVPVSMSRVMVTQESEAGTHMCWPEL